MRIKIAAVAIAVVALSAAVGTSAFTTGSVARSTNVDVVSDDVGLIALSDGTSGGLVSQTADKLTIDFTASGAGGVNPDATYQLGDPADPTNKTAFNISNLGGSTKDLTVAYNNVEAGSVGDGTTNIEFALYNSTGTQVATVSEESTSATVSNVASGSTLYVVLTVDSTGLDSTNSLSGTLNVSA